MADWRAAAAQASRSFLTGHSDLPESEYAHAGPEPLLDEILDDPMVQLIMQADHVQAADVRRLLFPWQSEQKARELIEESLGRSIAAATADLLPQLSARVAPAP